MIDVDAVVFDHPSGPVLRGVSFVVRAGAAVGLVGPAGSGKSMLLRCIATLETPGAGRITVAGLDTARDPRAVHARLGYLPRTFGLYDGLTVGQCLRYAAQSRGVAEARAEDAAVEAAETVGLAGRMPTLAGALSAPERQRLALAQANVHRPRVLLLDEPEGADALGGLMRRFVEDGVTIMVSAVDREAVPAGCTDLLALEAGEVVSAGVERLRPPLPETRSVP